MSLMDAIRRMGEKKKITKEKFRQAQEDRKIENMLNEREKSSNQRELESHFKKQEEAKIKTALDKIHKKQNHDSWKGSNMLKGQTNILKNDRPILKSNNSILKGKNMFLDNKSEIPFVNQGEMFLK